MTKIVVNHAGEFTEPLILVLLFNIIKSLYKVKEIIKNILSSCHKTILGNDFYFK